MQDNNGNKADDLTRRALLRTTFAAGFALAVQPIAEATIQTDTVGLTAGSVKVKGPDGVEFSAYRAYPSPKIIKPFPVVLVIHEIFGVHEHIKDVCRRFAKRGYFAIAPDLYARQGDVLNVANIGEIISKVVSKVPDAQVTGDLDATLAYAQSTGVADVARVGVTGFCWGGRQTWLYAAHNPKIKAGGAWYGPLGGAPSDLQPKSVIDVAPDITVPVLGQYGGKDTNIPLTDVARVEQILAQGHSGSELVVYTEAGHGFNADYRPSYDPKAAIEGFERLMGWFKGYGVG